MTSRLSPVEVTNFVKGIISDGNPMSFPEGATLDEQNVELILDGTRRRRAGLDAEPSHTLRTTSSLSYEGDRVVYNSHKWENVAGIPHLSFNVVQIGNYIAVYNTAYDNVSTNGFIYEYTFTNVSEKIAFSSVDGILVAAHGSGDISYFEYDEETNTVSRNSYRLLVRDHFGVEDVLGGVNYREGSSVAKRPIELTQAHSYNLRNQTWATPRLGKLALEVGDPIRMYKNYSVTKFPSNADSVLDALYPDTNDLFDPLTDRFHQKEVAVNKAGTLSAPRGYFIIDALNRGSSRLAEVAKLYDENPALQESYRVVDLPLDSTSGGAKVLAQYAGRMFYAGFSSDVTDGDAHSPRLGSYVLFSKLIESPADLKACYQQGDPTSKDYSEVLDTDGGFIRLEGAYNIVAMVPVLKGLAVLAENGVWLISGEDMGQFKATSYSTSRISREGCDCPTSVVAIGDGFWYWSSESIYSCMPDKYGDLIVNNESQGRIQNLYNSIPAMDKIYCVGKHDKINRTIRWLTGGSTSSEDSPMELVYYTDFGAFVKNVFDKPIVTPEVGDPYTDVFPYPACFVEVPPYNSTTVTEAVYVGEEAVLVDTEEVYVDALSTSSVANTELKYVLIGGISGGEIEYTFGGYINTDHYDWTSLHTSVDANAWMKTGWLSGGDNHRFKQAPFLIMHFYKTESGFYELNGDYELLDKSSCLIQTQWSWANHVNSGKWGTAFQAYRLGRMWFPNTVDDNYDNGFYTVVTRNKLRGSGKVLSLLMQSEPGKHLHIIGWSMMVGVAGGV